MPTAGGPNTLGESNLVSAYDTGDVSNSYIGEPTVNLVPTQTISSWSNLVHVSSTGDSITPPIKGLIVNRVSRTSTSATYFYSGNTWATTRASFGYFKAGTITQVTILGNSYNSGIYATFDLLAGTITAYQTVTPFIENVGEGWYRCGFSVTNGPSYPFIITLNGYTNETVTSGQYLYICGTQCEAKNHATPFTAGTRSATQGLLPLIGNSTIDLSNVSFDSSAKITFDGTNDYVSIPSKSFTINEPWSFSLLVKTNTAISSAWKNLIGATGDTECMWMMHPGGFALYQAYYNSQTYIWWSGINVANMLVNTWNSITITCSPVNSTTTYFTSYLNGNKINEGTFTWAPINTTQVFSRIGGNGSRYFHGEIPVAKIYNRALTAQEIKQNYQQYKTRFNLS